MNSVVQVSGLIWCKGFQELKGQLLHYKIMPFFYQHRCHVRMQCMYSVKPLREALNSFKPATTDGGSKLVTAARELMQVSGFLLIIGGRSVFLLCSACLCLRASKDYD